MICLKKQSVFTDLALKTCTLYGKIPVIMRVILSMIKIKTCIFFSILNLM